MYIIMIHLRTPSHTLTNQVHEDLPVHSMAQHRAAGVELPVGRGVGTVT